MSFFPFFHSVLVLGGSGGIGSFAIQVVLGCTESCQMLC